MPQPAGFATDNAFNALEPFEDEQGNNLRDAIIKEYKQARNTRNRSELMHSEGENLTVTADPTLFEDPIPLAQLKDADNAHRSGLGGAASKLQQVLCLQRISTAGHKRNASHITCNTSMDILPVKTVEDMGHLAKSDAVNPAGQRLDSQFSDDKFQRPKPSMRSKECTCPSVFKQLQEQQQRSGIGQRLQSKSYAACGDMCRNVPPSRQKEIIQNLLKKEIGKGNYIGLRSSKKGLPPKDNGSHRRNNERSKETNLRLMNIINAKWWHQWCDYTSFNLNTGTPSAVREKEEQERVKRSGSV